MKNLFTLVIAVLFFEGAATAQKTEGIAGFITLGYINAPAAGRTLNRIAPGNVSGFSDHFMSFGLEAYYRHAKTILIGGRNVWCAKNTYFWFYLCRTFLWRCLRQSRMDYQ